MHCLCLCTALAPAPHPPPPPPPSHPPPLCTPAQKLVAAWLPIALVTQLFPSRFRCLADQVVPSVPAYNRLVAPPKPKVLALGPHLAAIKLPRLFEAVIAELGVMVRGLFLAFLFTPAIMSAPLAFYLDAPELRARWMSLLTWTLERAGPAFM